MDVSIIIVNYNTFAYTKNAIESVFLKTESIGYEVIVVDNNSPDGSGKLLQECFGDKIVYVQSSENVGFGQANNLGAKHARGRYLFLLNPDTILLNNAVKILFDFLETHEDAKIAGGALCDVNGNPNAGYGYFPTLIMEFLAIGFHRFFKAYYKKRFFSVIPILGNTPFVVDYVSGADMMIEKKAFDELHGFDKDIFMYYEETELQFRAKGKGKRCFIVPNARIIHLEEWTSTEKRAERLKMLSVSKKIFFRKCYGVYGLLMLNIFTFVNRTAHRIFGKGNKL